MGRSLIALTAAGLFLTYAASTQAATYSFSYDPTDILMGGGVSSVDHVFDVSDRIIDYSLITDATLSVYLNDSNPGVASLHVSEDFVDGRSIGISVWGESNHVATYVQDPTLISALKESGSFTLSVRFGSDFFNSDVYKYDKAILTVGTNPVPIPGAFWLFGSGMVGLIAYRKIT